LWDCVLGAHDVNIAAHNKRWGCNTADLIFWNIFKSAHALDSLIEHTLEGFGKRQTPPQAYAPLPEPPEPFRLES
jgi:hypothetical protein